MRSSRLFFAILSAIFLIHAAAATAEGAIDMDDPRRVVGREDDVRIDAQLVQDTVTPGSPIGVTWQIQNFTKSPVAVATKVMSASYDMESRVITLAVGAEVPVDGNMPLMVVIAPGEKKVFRAGATPAYNAAAMRAGGNLPAFVQVKVSILRDVTPFATISSGRRLTDAEFDQWFEATDTIFLNIVPVRFSPRRNLFDASADASARF